MRKLNKQLFKLLKLHSPSGKEWDVITYVLPILRDTMDHVELDAYGNILAEKRYGDSGYTVLLSSHMDTVAHHQPEPKWRKHKSEIFNASPNKSALGGDDKCGIAAHLAIIREMNRQTDFKGTLKLCFSREEECGCVGAAKAVKLSPSFFKDVNAAIVIDRRGADHVIDGSYSERFCSLEYSDFWVAMAAKVGFVAKPQDGTISDTMIFSELGINGVNLSAGYYDAHCPTEYIRVDELKRTVRWVLEAMDNIESKGAFPSFHYYEEKETKWFPKYQNRLYDFDFDDKYEGLYECSECCDLYPAHDIIVYDDGSYVCDKCDNFDRIEECNYCLGEHDAHEMFDYKGFRLCADCVLDLEMEKHYVDKI